jgi:hypothetical protein
VVIPRALRASASGGEPSYSYSFIGGHEQSLGVSVGLLIPIYAK